jgi:hypothetical protein
MQSSAHSLQALRLAGRLASIVGHTFRKKVGIQRRRKKVTSDTENEKSFYSVTLGGRRAIASSDYRRIKRIALPWRSKLICKIAG